MIRESVMREFRHLERESIIALDWDKDIAPMLEDEDKVFLNVVFGDSIDKILTIHKNSDMMTQLTGDQPIEDARRIVFELTMRPGYDLSLSDIKPLAEYFSSLPNHPDIIWGCSRVPSQNHNVILKILFTI